MEEKIQQLVGVRRKVAITLWSELTTLLKGSTDSPQSNQSHSYTTRSKSKCISGEDSNNIHNEEEEKSKTQSPRQKKQRKYSKSHAVKTPEKPNVKLKVEGDSTPNRTISSPEKITRQSRRASDRFHSILSSLTPRTNHIKKQKKIMPTTTSDSDQNTESEDAAKQCIKTEEVEKNDLGTETTETNISTMDSKINEGSEKDKPSTIITMKTTKDCTMVTKCNTQHLNKWIKQQGFGIIVVSPVPDLEITATPTVNTQVSATETNPSSKLLAKEKPKVGRKSRRRRHRPVAEGPLKCDVCSKVVASQTALIVHERTHSGERPYVCDVCGRSFSVKVNCKKHMLRHTNNKPYKCEQCGAGYYEERHLKHHLHLHQLGQQTPLRRQFHHVSSSNVCDVCQRKFPCPSSMEVHRRIHTGEKPFKCDTCGKSFNVKSNYKLHMQIHSANKSFACRVCEEKFAVKRQLTAHTNKHHPKLKKPSSRGLVPSQPSNGADTPPETSPADPSQVTSSASSPSDPPAADSPPKYACEVCPRIYHFRSQLEAHVRCHSNQRPFCCDECGRCFKQKQSLLRHGVVHTGSRPYSCDDCGKSFSHQTTLLNHQKLHSASDNYHCSTCNKGFRQFQNMWRHQQYHVENRDFSCQHCSKTFVIKCELTRHEKTCHQSSAAQAKAKAPGNKTAAKSSRGRAGSAAKFHIQQVVIDAAQSQQIVLHTPVQMNVDCMDVPHLPDEALLQGDQSVEPLTETDPAVVGVDVNDAANPLQSLVNNQNVLFVKLSEEGDQTSSPGHGGEVALPSTLSPAPVEQLDLQAASLGAEEVRQIVIQPEEGDESKLVCVDDSLQRAIAGDVSGLYVFHCTQCGKQFPRFLDVIHHPCDGDPLTKDIVKEDEMHVGQLEIEEQQPIGDPEPLGYVPEEGVAEECMSVGGVGEVEMCVETSVVPQPAIQLVSLIDQSALETQLQQLQRSNTPTLPV